MIARITRYRTPPEDLEPLIEEIVALAHARSKWPGQRTNLRAEFFLINTSDGNGLSLVIGDDSTVTPLIELGLRSSDDPEECDVHLLQVGGPRGSGVVDALFCRVVRCDPGAPDELSFNGDAVPTSEDVWAPALLVAPSGEVVTFAVAADRAALEHSLDKFSACPHVDDDDDVAYHVYVDDTH